MRTFAWSALTVGVAAALLVGCGAPPPIGAPATGAQALRAVTSSFQVLHRFGRHDKTRGGANPSGPLLDVNGTLYGTTSNGGRGGYGGNGLVYSMTTTGATKVLYLFRGYQNGDGVNPADGVVNVGSTLYGTTRAGGLRTTESFTAGARRRAGRPCCIVFALPLVGMRQEVCSTSTALSTA